ncbi:hypothetical protein [Actinopolyspora alba]|nr:hypothetical protein [Actinopolyspora alba]
MVTPSEHVQEQLQPLCEPIHKALEFGVGKEKECRSSYGLDKQTYDYLGIHMARAFAHSWLAKHADDLGGWQLAGKHSRNGELWLRQGMTRLRMLHTRSPSDVPEAGPNEARKLYFRNLPLEGLPEQATFEELEASKLLGLWRVAPQTGEVTVRIARTIRASRCGSRFPVDVHFQLPRAADDLANAAWMPDDSGILFDDEKEEGEDDAGGFLG